MSATKLLIVGADERPGTDVARLLVPLATVAVLAFHDLDIMDRGSLKQAIESGHSDTAVNCPAGTTRRGDGLAQDLVDHTQIGCTVTDASEATLPAPRATFQRAGNECARGGLVVKMTSLVGHKPGTDHMFLAITLSHGWVGRRSGLVWWSRESLRLMAYRGAHAMGCQGAIIWGTTKPSGRPSRLLDVSRAERKCGFKARMLLRPGVAQLTDSGGQ